MQNYSLGIILGLIMGKSVGVFIFTRLAVLLNISTLPQGLNWKIVFGVGLLAGIGFTMSIFITLLAFEDATIINNTKFVILVSSLLAGLLGYFTLGTLLTSDTDDHSATH